jgi:hypothetical protein
MSINRRLLAIIGQRLPAIFDIIPRGSLRSLSTFSLNPQPLPPQELGAAIASEFMQSVWLTMRSGQDPAIALGDLEDWCPTYPKLPKWPIWWLPIPEPEPHPEWSVDFHLGFAARLAAITAVQNDLPITEILNKAIDRSVGSIESTLNQ